MNQPPCDKCPHAASSLSGFLSVLIYGIAIGIAIGIILPKLPIW